MDSFSNKRADTFTRQISPHSRDSTPSRGHGKSLHSRVLADAEDSHHSFREDIRGFRSVLEFQEGKTRAARRKTAKLLRLEPFMDWVEWYEDIGEPADLGWSSVVVTSPAFGKVSSLVILINTAFIAYASDWSMKNIGAPNPAGMMVTELIFLSFYVVELLLRLETYRWHFIAPKRVHWHMFDLILVVFSLCNVIVMVSFGDMGNESSVWNLSFLRICRFLRLVKILRTLRLMKVFEDLALMLNIIRNSFATLFWCFVMLSFITFICSLVFMEGLSEYIANTKGELDETDKEEIVGAFGSLASSMVSLYMATTGGNDWEVYYLIVTRAGTLYAFGFLVYIFFFTFSLFNILTGVFVDHAMSAAQPDVEARTLDARKEIQIQCEELKHILKKVDNDCSGFISRKEFNEHIHNPYFAAYLASLGLDVHDAEFFYNLIASGGNDLNHTDQEIPLDRFVEGCLSMRGSATSIDMQRQLAETYHIKVQLKRIAHTLASMSRDTDGEMQAPSNVMNVDAASSGCTAAIDRVLNEERDVCVSIPTDHRQDTPLNMVQVEESMRNMWANIKEELTTQFVPQLSSSIAKAIELQLWSTSKNFADAIWLQSEVSSAGQEKSKTATSNDSMPPQMPLAEVEEIRRNRTFEVPNLTGCTLKPTSQDVAISFDDRVSVGMHRIMCVTSETNESRHIKDHRGDIEVDMTVAPEKQQVMIVGHVDEAQLNATDQRDNDSGFGHVQREKHEDHPTMLVTPVVASSCLNREGNIEIVCLANEPTCVAFAAAACQHDDAARENVNLANIIDRSDPVLWHGSDCARFSPLVDILDQISQNHLESREASSSSHENHHGVKSNAASHELPVAASTEEHVSLTTGQILFQDQPKKDEDFH